MEGVKAGNHFLVQFFAWPQSDDFYLCGFIHRSGNCQDVVRFDLRSDDFTSQRIFYGPEGYMYTLVYCCHEPGHVGMGDGKYPVLFVLSEKE